MTVGERPERWPWVALACSSLTMLVLGGWAASLLAPTLDEPWHLRYGGRILELGSAARVAWFEDGLMPWSAIPAAFAGVGAEGPDAFEQIVKARLATVLCLTLLPTVLFAGGWLAHGSLRAGGIAALLPLGSPNLLAHGALATTDVPAALGWGLATVGLLAWSRRAGPVAFSVLLAGLGLAFLTKFTSLFLLATLLVAAPVAAALGGRPRRRRVVGSIGATASAGLLSLCALQASDPAPISIASVRSSTESANAIIAHPQPGPIPPDPLPIPGGIVGAMPLFVPDDWAIGLHLVRAHEIKGHPSYLLGVVRSDGRPLYYLVLLLFKTPVAAQVLWLLTIVARLRRRARFEASDLLLLGAGLVLLVVASASSLQLGLRHLLVALPGAQIWLAREMAFALDSPRSRRSAIAAAALGISAAGATLSIHPYELSFFNAWAGGPAEGWKVATDSNLDWGQENFLVADYVANSPSAVSVRPAEPVPGLVAISANDRVGGGYRWLEERSVVDRVGWTWFIYGPEDQP